MNKTNAAGLLDYLKTRVGCFYLSDFHDPRLLPLIQNILCEIDPWGFSVWEWNDAVEYITGAKHSFNTQKQARQYLLEFSHL